MKVLATADLHFPKYYKEFLNNLHKEETDLIIFAGDLIDNDQYIYLKKLYNLIKQYFGNVQVVSVFGNNEWDKDLIKRNFPELNFLDDGIFYFDNVAIVGTEGILDMPTKWKLKHIPNIIEIYNERLQKIRNLLFEARRNAKKVILVTHYSPTYKTLVGENPKIYKNLGSLKMEKVILETRPDVIIHGHAHKSKVKFVEIDGIKVYNVAWPVNKKLVEIKI